MYDLIAIFFIITVTLCFWCYVAGVTKGAEAQRKYYRERREMGGPNYDKI